MKMANRGKNQSEHKQLKPKKKSNPIQKETSRLDGSDGAKMEITVTADRKKKSKRKVSKSDTNSKKPKIQIAHSPALRPKSPDKTPSFYVAKGWHNRFAGRNGENLNEAIKRFKVKIKMAPRETADTGIYVDADAKKVDEVRRFFENVIGFSIGTTPLQEIKCKIVPLEISKLLESRKTYISIVQKYGVAVAFPKQGSDGETMIQGQSKDILGAIAEFEKVVGRTIEMETIVPKKKKNSDVAHHRFHHTMSRLAVEYNEMLFFHHWNNDGPNFERFLGMLSMAERTIDICVFTLTDSRIRYCLADAVREGVKIRIITDNSQVGSLGSKALWLNDVAGIPVKVDYDPQEVSHMHHKFCIMDDRVVMTGSFNWTRSASDKNYENIMITTQEECVKQLREYFEKMWSQDKSIISISECPLQNYSNQSRQEQTHSHWKHRRQRKRGSPMAQLFAPRRKRRRFR